MTRGDRHASSGSHQTREALKASSRMMAWSGVQNIFHQALHLAVLMLLARLLSETDYGIMSIIVFFIIIGQAVIDSGFSIAILQRKHISPIELNSVFVFNVAMCILFYALIFFSADAIADYYSQPLVAPTLRVLGLKILTFPVALVASIVLRRELKLKTITLLNLAGDTAGGAAAIAMAMAGWGLWSLIFQQLILASIMCVGQLWCCSWRPRLEFSLDAFKSLFHFSIKILGTEMLTQCAKNLYALVIGKFYSVPDAGIVGRAQGVAQTPTAVLTSTMGDGASLVLYRYHHESVPGEMLCAVRSLHRLYCFVGIPAMLFICVLAEPIVTVLLSAKWLAAVPYLRIIAVMGIFYPTQYYAQTVIKINDKPSWLLRFETVQQILVVAALLGCAWSGLSIQGLLIGQICVQCAAFFGYAFFMKKLIGYRPRMLFADLFPIFAAALPAAAAAAGILVWVKSFPALAGLFASLTSGAIVYLIISILMKSVALHELFAIYGKAVLPPWLRRS